MTLFIILDVIQSLTMLTTMSITMRNILAHDILKSYNKLLILIPLTGIIQLTFASCGSIFLENTTDKFIYTAITWIYIAVEMAVILTIFSHFIPNILIKSLIGFLAIIVFFTLSIRINEQIKSSLFSLASICESVYLICICLSVYLQLIFDNKVLNLLQEPIFFFNTGVFILFSTTLPIYSLAFILEDNMKEYFPEYSFINTISYVSFYYFLNKYIIIWKLIHRQ